jgi:hypothetical protein
VSTTFPHTVTVSPACFFASEAAMRGGVALCAKARGDRPVRHIITIRVFIFVMFQSPWCGFERESQQIQEISAA